MRIYSGLGRIVVPLVVALGLLPACDTEDHCAGLRDEVADSEDIEDTIVAVEDYQAICVPETFRQVVGTCSDGKRLDCGTLEYGCYQGGSPGACALQSDCCGTVHPTAHRG